jgi:carbonic anhydrase
MHIIDISGLVQRKPVLIISCVECLVIPEKDEKTVFAYTSLGTALSYADPTLRHHMSYFVDSKKCAEIIIAGHSHCDALDYIMHGSSTDLTVLSLKSDLDTLFNNHQLGIVNKSLQERMLIELNIIRQGSLLMSFDFIRRRVERGDLNVTGIVYDENQKTTNKLFLNGLSFNTLVEMS